MRTVMGVSRCCCGTGTPPPPDPFCPVTNETSYFDSFDSPPLDPGWTVRDGNGNWQIDSGQLFAPQLPGGSAGTLARLSTFDVNVSAQMTFEVEIYGEWESDPNKQYLNLGLTTDSPSGPNNWSLIARPALGDFRATAFGDSFTISQAPQSGDILKIVIGAHSFDGTDVTLNINFYVNNELVGNRSSVQAAIGLCSMWAGVEATTTTGLYDSPARFDNYNFASG